MISIIICSINKSSLDRLIHNIRETIGVEHEIIAFDNRAAGLGIAEVYNDAASRSSFPYLCFIHEDINFETPDWGKKLMGHLSDPQLGLLGIAGGDTKGLVPSSWSSSVFESEISLVQYFRDGSKPSETIIKTGYPENKEKLKKVSCIDGVFMCTRQDVMKRFQFDEITCNSFHGYDIDFSMQVNTHYNVGVAFDIILHHFSDGVFGREWLKNSIRVSDKWRARLPYSVRPLSESEFIRQHWTSMNVFIDKMIQLGYNRLFIVSQFFKYSFNRYFHFKHFLHSSRKIIFKIKG